jgi:hypothetical protein
MKTETCKIEDINSQGIEIEATRQGVSELDFLGKYQHPEHPGSNDWTISIYRFPNGTRAASTNGDPIWEESDPQAFAEMLEEYKINIPARLNVKITRAGYVYIGGKKISAQKLTPINIPVGTPDWALDACQAWNKKNWKMV